MAEAKLAHNGHFFQGFSYLIPRLKELRYETRAFHKRARRTLRGISLSKGRRNLRSKDLMVKDRTYLP